MRMLPLPASTSASAYVPTIQRTSAGRGVAESRGGASTVLIAVAVMVVLVVGAAVGEGAGVGVRVAVCVRVRVRVRRGVDWVGVCV